MVYALLQYPSHSIANYELLWGKSPYRGSDPTFVCSAAPPSCRSTLRQHAGRFTIIYYRLRKEIPRKSAGGNRRRREIQESVKNKDPISHKILTGGPGTPWHPLSILLLRFFLKKYFYIWSFLRVPTPRRQSWPMSYDKKPPALLGVATTITSCCRPSEHEHCRRSSGATVALPFINKPLIDMLWMCALPDAS